MNKYKYVDRPSILEIGGANSCFYEVICDQVLPVTYSIFDNNVLGLQKFRERISNLKEFSSELIQGDILNPQYQEKFDIVFSVGLIEHFDVENTRKAFLNHLQFVKSPGLLIVTFPTPTFLYRITRFFAECLDMWMFHDERPIQEPEIRSLVPSLDYNIRDYSIIWSIILTQGMIVITKV
ncbi:class I SAM-dependent methyltransferase [Leptospira santarosai]|nr:class I SAM-dependent methyltransferase [Leptospira santarosai]MDI7198424.1 class I SAM-dependent methyltransferase [Leptospira santarosai]MDI7205189.1 class I SAM-dependent methyltransferase [Leptospira santarosai]